MTLTVQGEQEALEAFKQWYQREQPTINHASMHVHVIACDVVRGLSAEQCITLLQEHPEWVQTPVPDTCPSLIATKSLRISYLVHELFVKHLEQVIQARGFHFVCKEQGAS